MSELSDSDSVPNNEASSASPAARSSLIGRVAALCGHSEALIYGFTVTLVGAAWLALGAFSYEQRNDVVSDARAQMLDARNTLASYADSSHEASAVLLNAASEWLSTDAKQPNPAGLDELQAYLRRLTYLDPNAIAVAAIDAQGHQVSLTVPTATLDSGPSAFTELGANARGSVDLGRARFDPATGWLVLPYAQRAPSNAYKLKTLLALVSLQPGEGPFGSLLAGLPARLGIMRDDGSLLLLWSGAVGANGARPVPARVRPLSHMEFASQKEFLGLSPVHVSVATVDAAPIRVFAALPDSYFTDELAQRLNLPVAVTVLASVMALLAGFWIGRMVHHRRLEGENTKQALAAAEAANVAKQHFLAVMSHELRTPLNAIIGFSEILKAQLFGPLGSKNYVDYATDILSSGRDLLALIQAILDMARFEQNKVAIGDTPTVLHSAVAEAVRLLGEKFVAQSVEAKIEIDPRCPALAINPLHLKQLLFNLIGNAIKFSRPRGVVTVEGEGTPDGGILLRISDTGIGIASEHRDRLFKPFSQVSGAYSRKQGGVGLGLSICKSIVEAYGGRIWIDSIQDAGTTVSVVFTAERALPLAPDNEAGLVLSSSGLAA